MESWMYVCLKMKTNLTEALKKVEDIKQYHLFRKILLRVSAEYFFSISILIFDNLHTYSY